MYIQYYVRVENYIPQTQYPVFEPYYMQIAVSYEESDALFAKWVVHTFENYTRWGSSCTIKLDMYAVPNIQKHHKTYTFMRGKVILAKVVLIPSLSSEEPDEESITGGLL